MNPDACGVYALETEVSEGGFGLRVDLGEVILRRRPGGYVHGLAREWVTRDRGRVKAGARDGRQWPVDRERSQSSHCNRSQ